MEKKGNDFIQPLCLTMRWPVCWAVCCCLMFGHFSGLMADDYAQILIPNPAGPWIRLFGDGDDLTCKDECCQWWKYDGQGIWSCPRCGSSGNIPLAERCARCGYGRSNPEGYLLCPVRSVCVTNRYSAGHRAVDFGVPEGTPVFAAGDGIVTGVIENDRSRGNVLKIAHEDSVETLYGHLREILVPLGGYVRMGEAVALSGNTGASTGPHLHFEVYLDGEADDPSYHLGPWQ